jgi:hypothetical protein
MKARVLVHDDDLVAQAVDRECIGGVDVLLIGLRVIWFCVIWFRVIVRVVPMRWLVLFVQVWILHVGGVWRGQHLGGLCVRGQLGSRCCLLGLVDRPLPRHDRRSKAGLGRCRRSHRVGRPLEHLLARRTTAANGVDHQHHGSNTAGSNAAPRPRNVLREEGNHEEHTADDDCSERENQHVSSVLSCPARPAGPLEHPHRDEQSPRAPRHHADPALAAGTRGRTSGACGTPARRC